MTRYLTAREAADALSVTLPTLYAYVSRGLIRSEAVDESRRQRRYNAEDVESLLLKKQAPAEAALHWGAPVMDSAITLISDGKLFYRGQDATVLALSYAFEVVVTLLWGSEIDNWTDPHPAEGEVRQLMAGLDHTLSEVQRLQMALIYAEALDLAAYDLRPQAVIQTGRRILHLLVALVTDETNPGVNIASRLQRSWGGDFDLINAALILCADHELNSSSFVGRITASAGSTPYQAVIGAMAAFQGSKHGGHTERVEAFIREVEMLGSARAAISERLRRGDGIPGFGHKIYPEGDPRAAFLLEKLPDHPATHLAQEVIREVYQTIGERPTIDVAIVIMGRVMGWSPGKALLLFTLGRTAGWIGQVLEQVQDGRLIRPRARYTGNTPG